MLENNALYLKSVKEVFEILNTNNKGLSREDAYVYYQLTREVLKC